MSHPILYTDIISPKLQVGMDELMGFGAQQQRKRKSRNMKMKLSTGLNSLDTMLDGGFRGGDLIVLTGRPAVGKTSLALQIASFIAQEIPQKICVFSMSESAEQLTHILARQSGTDPNEMERSTLIYDAPMETPKRIATKLSERNNIGFVIIDYLQLMTKEDSGMLRETDFVRVSGELRKIAEEFQVSILCTSALHKGRINTALGVKHPRLYDCGKFENVAVLLSLYRNTDVVCGKESCAAEIAILKNCYGDTEVFSISLDDDTLKFAE